MSSDFRRRAILPSRLVLSVSSFRDDLLSGHLDLVGFLDHAWRLGFRQVELCDRSIPSVDSRDLERIARTCAQRGLRVACVDIRSDFTLQEVNALERQIAHVERWIGATRALDSSLARVWIGRAEVDEDAFHRACRAFRRVIRTAERCEVRLAVENHGGISQDADTLVQIVDFVGSSYLGTCPDPGWFEAENLYRSLWKIFPYAFHFHAKTHAFTADGQERDLDYAEIAAIAWATSYRGLLSVEFEGEGNDRLGGVMQTVALLEHCFAL